VRCCSGGRHADAPACKPTESSCTHQHACRRAHAQDDDRGDGLVSIELGPSSSGALTPASASAHGGGSPPAGSRSPSSSASLSSPGGECLSSLAQGLAWSPGRPTIQSARRSHYQYQPTPRPRPTPSRTNNTGLHSSGGAIDSAAHPGSGGAHGESAWEEGPAGITFAEPVTTPTKAPSRRSSTSEPKPTLSRVESLSNSFIDDLESDLECSGPGPGDDEAAGAGGGDAGAGAGTEEGASTGEPAPSGGDAPPSTGDEGSVSGGAVGAAEIEFALPSNVSSGADDCKKEAPQQQQQQQQQQQPKAVHKGSSSSFLSGGMQHVESGAAIDNGSSSDLPGIFDIALRLTAGSRASSMDVLHGSVMGAASDVGSERGFSLGATSGAAASSGGGADSGAAFSSPPPPPHTHRPSPLGAPAASGAAEGSSSWEASLQK